MKTIGERSPAYVVSSSWSLQGMELKLPCTAIHTACQFPCQHDHFQHDCFKGPSNQSRKQKTFVSGGFLETICSLVHIVDLNPSIDRRLNSDYIATRAAVYGVSEILDAKVCHVTCSPSWIGVASIHRSGIPEPLDSSSKVLILSSYCI